MSANKDAQGKSPAGIYILNNSSVLVVLMAFFEAVSLPVDEEPQINLKEEIELKEQLGKGALCKVHKGMQE